MQPGDTITPQGAPSSDDKTPLESGVEIILPTPRQAEAPAPPVELPQAQEQAEVLVTPPLPAVEPAAPAPVEQASLAAPEPEWQPTYDQQDDPYEGQPIPEVRWSASEFIAHQKSTNWFAALGLIVAGVALLIYLITREIFSSVVVVVVGILFGVFAIRQPRVLEYVVSTNGIQIGDKFYGYDLFKAFSIQEEGPLRSVVLSPLQRFMPPISIYYELPDEDRIAEVLSNYLPFEQAPRDSMGTFMRRVRF